MENDKLAQAMKSLAENAAILAREQYGLEFDYSEDSLKLVEQIISKMSKDIPKTWLGRFLGRGPSKKQIASICKLMGAYIGEVLSRKWNVTWQIDATFGSPLPAIPINDGVIYPTNKVYKRLVGGESENIWTYYEMLEHMVEHGPQDG